MLRVISEEITAYRRQIDERKNDLPLWERKVLTCDEAAAYSGMLVAGVAVGIYAAVELSVGAVVGAVVCLGLGIMALLCWKNQNIVVLSDESFEYSTFLGNKKEYRFQDITGLKQNNDSMTLFVGNEKVHIESCDLLTDRLIELINAQLEKLQGKE